MLNNNNYISDTTMERNTLMAQCYPKLKDYCREKHGLEFQVRILIDKKIITQRNLLFYYDIYSKTMNYIFLLIFAVPGTITYMIRLLTSDKDQVKFNNYI